MSKVYTHTNALNLIDIDTDDTTDIRHTPEFAAIKTLVAQLANHPGGRTMRSLKGALEDRLLLALDALEAEGKLIRHDRGLIVRYEVR